ncbi:MAG: efflux RND transporter periplasmic adaptor subunit [Ardenticatenaceae bacterium]|nr:efflux RND transporter periplasmic adaptor subunit [Ardenticatenaceae bacterium]
MSQVIDSAKNIEDIMPNNRKRLIPVIVIVLVVIIGYGVYSFYQSYWANSEQIVTGTIEAKEVHLGMVTGGIVEEMLVEEGDAVHVDQLLAVVDSVSGGSGDRLRSPIDGVVLLRAAEPGEITVAGGSLLVIANLDEMTLTMYVPEDQYGKIYLGQEYPITVDSFPDRVFMGKVTHIADQAEFTPQNIRTVEGRKSTVYAIRMTIPNPNHDLKPGMPADVTLNLQ